MVAHRATKDIGLLDPVVAVDGFALGTVDAV